MCILLTLLLLCCALWAGLTLGVSAISNKYSFILHYIPIDRALAAFSVRFRPGVYTKHLLVCKVTFSTCNQTALAGYLALISVRKGSGVRSQRSEVIKADELCNECCVVLQTETSYALLTYPQTARKREREREKFVKDANTQKVQKNAVY